MQPFEYEVDTAHQFSIHDAYKYVFRAHTVASVPFHQSSGSNRSKALARIPSESNLVSFDIIANRVLHRFGQFRESPSS